MQELSEDIWQRKPAREIMREARKRFSATIFGGRNTGFSIDKNRWASAHVALASAHYSLVKRYLTWWKRPLALWHTWRAATHTHIADEMM